MMNKELKISLLFLLVLSILPPALLYSLTGIHPFSKPFLAGFFPFLFLLVPYLLFSTSQTTLFLQEKFANSLKWKLIPPLYLLVHYSILQFLYSSFQWNFFLLFLFWLAIPTFLFIRAARSQINLGATTLWGWLDFAVVLLLWLPIEFGWLRGFELRFSEQTRISALPLAAPLFGLYLFLLLRKLYDIGYTFLWRGKDLLIAGVALLALALILIPLGTASGFIRWSVREVSVPEIFQFVFGIYFFVALPEELLFRGIIQNLLSKTIQIQNSKWFALILASVIFGLSHLNNPPVPNWKYAMLATIAGIFYGTTYLKTGKSTVSAIVHCGVNFVWTMVFKDTPG